MVVLLIIWWTNAYGGFTNLQFAHRWHKLTSFIRLYIWLPLALSSVPKRHWWKHSSSPHPTPKVEGQDLILEFTPLWGWLHHGLRAPCPLFWDTMSGNSARACPAWVSLLGAYAPTDIAPKITDAHNPPHLAIKVPSKRWCPLGRNDTNILC
jgi:hypothetical protein